MSRQNFYKARQARQRRAVDEGLVIELVRSERRQQPRLGGRKVLHVLGPALAHANVRVGRDRFFALLKKQDMLVPRLPRGRQTTKSDHDFRVYPNLLKGTACTAPNQRWVSDITYICTKEAFVYLSLVTDVYSRRIVGYAVAATLSTEGPMQALKMALGEKSADAKPIHHSDRGSQYCSHRYIKELNDNGVLISMTEQNHCAENALAERMNGIVKQEYGLGGVWRDLAQVATAVKQAVYLYNTKRPHQSLQYRTPEEVYAQAA